MIRIHHPIQLSIPFPTQIGSREVTSQGLDDEGCPITIVEDHEHVLFTRNARPVKEDENTTTLGFGALPDEQTKGISFGYFGDLKTDIGFVQCRQDPVSLKEAWASRMKDTEVQQFLDCLSRVEVPAGIVLSLDYVEMGYIPGNETVFIFARNKPTGAIYFDPTHFLSYDWSALVIE